MITVSRLTVLPCKSNLRMPVGGGVPSRVQLLLPIVRAANLTSWYKDISTRREAPLSFILSQQPTFIFPSLFVLASFRLRSSTLF